MTTGQETAKNPAKPPARRRWWIWTGFGAVLLGLVVAAVMMIGRPVTAPDWLRDRIEQRVATAFPGIDLSFGQVSVLLQRSGLARVILWDVELRNPQGAVIIHLSDIEAGFLPGPLLRGQLVPRQAQVSGAFVTLTRARNGHLGLSLGDAFGGQDAPELRQILAQVDGLLEDPRFAELHLLEADGLTLRFEDLRARRGWTVDGGYLRVERQQDRLELGGDLVLLGGGASVAALQLNASSQIGAPEVSFGVALDGLAARDIATQSPALAWLEALDAPISGRLRSEVLADGSLGPLNAVLSIGAGALAPNPATRPIPFDAARTYFTYTPETGDLIFDEVSLSSPLGQVAAEGRAQLLAAQDGWPNGLWGQFRLSGIEAAKGAVLDRAVSVDGAEMAFKLRFDPFELTLGELALSDPDLPLRASGRLIAEPDGWNLALDAVAERSTLAQVLSFWPEAFQPKARRWVAEHVRAGALHDIQYALRTTPSDPIRSHLDLRFADADVLYNKRLPPITAGKGRLTIDGARLGLRLDQGAITPAKGGAIAVGGSRFTIADLRLRPATGVLDLQARSSATAALSFVDNEAWAVLRKAGRDAGLATGRVAVQGQLSLPLRKGVTFSDVAMDLTGQLRDVASDRLVAGRRLTARSLALSLTNKEIAISGPVALDGVTGRGQWRQPLQGGGVGQVTARLDVTDQALRQFGVTLPEGMMTGAGTADLQLDLTRGEAARFQLDSALAGLGLSIPELGWSLPRSGTGRLELTGRLSQPIKIEQISLNAAGLRANGEVFLDGAGALDRIELARLRLDPWLNVKATLRGRGAGRAPKIELRGGRADLRQATFGQGTGRSEASRGGPLDVALDRLQISEGIALTRFAGRFDTTGGLRGDFTAQVNGKAEINGSLIPSAGRSAVRLRGEDAGDILSAAGVLKRVQDGSFLLDLAPVRDVPGTYDGQLTINGPRLQGGSAITALLDAISIVGILDQLNGPGIYFDEVEAQFRLTPRDVILRQSSAVGPSMGLSLDGFYSLETGEMDMQGVVSPIYILNSIGRLIARKGEGLIGFNFTMRGAADAPSIQVNPLSVFTPGMFRDIFRRPPPEVSQ